MNLVLVDLLFVDGLECAQADIQRDRGHLDASLPQPLQNRGGKMQAGGGRRHGSWMIGENRLVTLAVRRLVFARDVRRQRNVAEPLDRFGNVALCREANAPQPIFATADDFGGEFPISEVDALPNPNLSSWANQGLPLLWSNLPGQQYFDFGGQKFACREIGRASCRERV